MRGAACGEGMRGAARGEAMGGPPAARGWEYSVSYDASGPLVSPARQPSTFAALSLAAGAAIAGAAAWGLVTILVHRQLSLLSLLIGAAVGVAVARHRPGHLPTIVAGAVIAMAGCALGTLLAIVFSLLDARVSVAAIVGHASVVARAYPSAVGWLGLLFWLLAAYPAVSVPLRAARRSAAGQNEQA
jgi:hypothetical protein